MKIFRLIFWILPLWTVLPTWAQNLVPNGSFETITDCTPVRFLVDQLPIYRAAPWVSLTAIPAFVNNPCLPSYNYDNPGTPIPGHTGNGWVYVAGGVNQNDPLSQEKAQSHSLAVKLLRPLEAGKMYCFSSYIRVPYASNLITDPDPVKNVYVNVQGFGAYFSKDLPTFTLNPTILPFLPQIINREPYTTTWAPFRGCYRATGGENYLTLSLFANEAIQYKRMLLLLDDVSVTPLESQLLGLDTSFCAGSSVLLRATFPCAKSYRWSDGSTDSTLRVSKAGQYVVRVLSDCGDISDTITVWERRNELDLGPDTTLCVRKTLTLRVSPNSTLIRWNDESNQPTLTATTSGTYSVYTEQNGCQKRDEVVLRPLDSPTITLTADTTRCDDGPPVLLLADTTAIPNANRYQWSNGTTGPRLLVNQAGIYSVKVVNDCGMAQANVRIQVAPCRCDVLWPDSFTPNGDDVNDHFTGFVNCRHRPIKSIVWFVYNRWGEVVYQADTLLPGWDGTVRGQPYPTGVYAYKLTIITDRDGQPHTETVTGQVSLIR